MGMLMYRSDNNDLMPHAETWMDVLKDYVKQPQIFVDPEVGGKGEHGYAFNSRVAGKSDKAFPHPATYPMLFDSTNLAKNASDPFISLPDPGRHKGANVVGYLDGHVKRVLDDPK
jgi:prepilin-type processing-associated H-X9-DG protein